MAAPASALVGVALAGHVHASGDTQDRAGRDELATNATYGGIGRRALRRDPNTESDFVGKPPASDTRQAVKRNAQSRRDATVEWAVARANTSAEEPGGIDEDTGACGAEVGSEALTLGAPSQKGEESHGQEKETGSAHAGI